MGCGPQRDLSMRGKEEAHDYRYFPDPDLVPIVVGDDWVEAVRATLPELPEAKRERFISAIRPARPTMPRCSPPPKPSPTTSKRYGRRFPAARRSSATGSCPSCMRELKRDERDIEACPVAPENLAELLH